MRVWAKARVAGFACEDGWRLIGRGGELVVHRGCWCRDKVVFEILLTLAHVVQKLSRVEFQVLALITELGLT